jgi:hypothetical protein
MPRTKLWKFEIFWLYGPTPQKIECGKMKPNRSKDRAMHKENNPLLWFFLKIDIFENDVSNILLILIKLSC